MRRWEQEEERIRTAVLGAAEATAKELGMTEAEMLRALGDFSQHQMIAFSGASGRKMEEMQEAVKTFVTVWPSYLDATKTIPEGRRIPKERACPEPRVQDIAEILMELGLPCVTEPHKRYPRDFMAFGRVRVELINQNTGKPWVPELATRRALLFKLAETIPTLKSRKVRQAAEAALERAQLERGPAAASSSLAAGGGAEGEGALDVSGGGGGAKASNPKKKGKKKGRK